MTEQVFATKSEQAYWALRKAIVTGELADWAPLDEVALMAQFEVGRTPIREAIKQLANEEFVVWHRHRTPHVRTTSADDLASLYEARHIFEVPAARLAAERAVPSDIGLLERISDQMDTAMSRKRLYEVAELDYDFHVAVAKASHNRFLIESINRLNFGSLRLWYRSYELLGTQRINDHHRQELEAIRRRDAGHAVFVAEAHIQFSQERQLHLFGLGAVRGGRSERAASAAVAPGQRHASRRRAARSNAAG